MSRRKLFETQNVPGRRNPMVDSADLMREEDDLRNGLVPQNQDGDEDDPALPPGLQASVINKLIDSRHLPDMSGRRREDLSRLVEPLIPRQEHPVASTQTLEMRKGRDYDSVPGDRNQSSTLEMRKGRDYDAVPGDRNEMQLLSARTGGGAPTESGNPFSALWEPYVPGDDGSNVRVENLGLAHGDPEPAPKADPVGIVTKIGKDYETDPEPEAPDAEGMLAAALKKSRRREQAAMLFDAGDTAASAIAGRKEDPAYLDRLLDLAKNPVRDAQGQLSQKEKAYARAKAKYDASPASAGNRRMQGQLLAMDGVGEMLGGEDSVRSMTGDDAQSRWAMATAVYNRARQQGLDEASAKRLAEQAARQNEQFEETKRHNRASEENAHLQATKPPALPWSMNTEVRTPVDDRGTNENFIKLGKDTAGMAQFDSVLRQLDRLMPGITDGATSGTTPDGKPWDISKVYKWNERLMDKDPTGLAQNFMSPETKEALPILKQAMELLTRDRTGAVINDAEFQQQQEQWATKVAQDPKQLPVALKALKGLFQAKLKSKQLGYTHGRTSPWEAWKQSGGIAYDDPFYAQQNAAADAQAARGAVVPPQAPGREAPPLPTDVPVREPGGAAAPEPSNGPPPGLTPEKIARAKAKAPAGTVPMVAPDGTIEFVPQEQVQAATAANYAALR